MVASSSLGTLTLGVNADVDQALEALDKLSRGSKKAFDDLTKNANFAFSDISDQEIDDIFDGFGESAEEAGGKLDLLKDNAGKLPGVFGRIGGAAGPVAAGIAAIVAAAAGLSKVVKSFAEFELAIAEVSTLVDSAVVSNASLQKSVEDVAIQFGGDLNNQAKALYQIISAGAEAGADANALLAASNKLAVGGVTDVATAADGLTSILNAYNLSGSDAEQVTDALFATMRAGKTTIGELSGGIGKVAAQAATFGVSFQEVLAAVAEITKRGVKTDEAFTQIGAAITAVARNTEQSQEAAKELGIEFNTTALRTQGLVGFFEKLRESTNGNEDALVKLFGRIDGVKGVLNATSGGAGALSAQLDNVTNSSGQTNEAFEKVSGTLVSAGKRIASSFGVVLERVGQIAVGVLNLEDVAFVVEAAVGALAKGLAFLIDEFNDLPGPVKNLISTLNPLSLLFRGLRIALELLADGLEFIGDVFGKVKEAGSLFFGVFGDAKDRIEGYAEAADKAAESTEKIAESAADAAEKLRELNEELAISGATGRFVDPSDFIKSRAAVSALNKQFSETQRVIDKISIFKPEGSNAIGRFNSLANAAKSRIVELSRAIESIESDRKRGLSLLPDVERDLAKAKAQLKALTSFVKDEEEKKLKIREAALKKQKADAEKAAKERAKIEEKAAKEEEKRRKEALKFRNKVLNEERKIDAEIARERVGKKAEVTGRRSFEERRKAGELTAQETGRFARGQFAGELRNVGAAASSLTGEFGGLINAVVAAPSPLSAVVAGFSLLASESEEFREAQEDVAQAFSDLVEALGPLIKIAGKITSGLAEATSQISKGIGSVLGKIGFGGGPEESELAKSQRRQIASAERTANSLAALDASLQIVDAFGGNTESASEALKELRIAAEQAADAARTQTQTQDGLLSLDPVGDFRKRLEEEAEATRVTLEAQGLSDAEIDDVLRRGGFTTEQIDQAVEEFTKVVDQNLRRQALESRGLTQEQIGIIDSFADSAEDLEASSEELREATAQFSNVPEGFKGALARFDAAQSETRSLTTGAESAQQSIIGEGGQTGGDTIIIENVDAQVSDLDSFISEIQQRTNRRNLIQEGARFSPRRSIF